MMLLLTTRAAAASAKWCPGDSSVACPTTSDLAKCDRNDNACSNCDACLEAFYFATVPGLPTHHGFASRKPLAVGPSGGLLLSGDKRTYMVAANVWPPVSWADVTLLKVNFKDKTVKLRVAMSEVGCGCIAAAYLVNMNTTNEFLPGSKKGTGPVYCDVQGPTNTSVLHPSQRQLCIEDDLMEGNTKAFQSTLHTAFTSGADCKDCNQWGWKSCANGLGTFVTDRFGVGASVIDSSRPFDMVASYDQAASKFIALKQGGRSLGVWNHSFVKDGDCTGTAVPGTCSNVLGKTFDDDGMAIVLSLWKDGSGGNMSWLNGACDAAYPVCDLDAARVEVVHLEIASGADSFAASDYGTCRLNIPWQCCYDPGLGECTVPSDGSQYCYETAHNCLVDCGGKEYCHCKDAKGEGCEKKWFVPGSKGTDKEDGVTCQTKPNVEDEAVLATPAGGHDGTPCYKGRATYPQMACPVAA